MRLAYISELWTPILKIASSEKLLINKTELKTLKCIAKCLDLVLTHIAVLKFHLVEHSTSRQEASDHPRHENDDTVHHLRLSEE